MDAAGASAVPLLEVIGVSKRFPGVVALDDVSLDVRAGEVLGLMGENGAGKSTLLKILSGAQPPSGGRIRFGGADYRPAGPEAARAAGIVTIYQELSLVPTLSAAENVFVGRAPLRWGFVDWRRMRREAAAILGRVGLGIDPDTPASALSVAEQQLVEIARALSLGGRLIIMDEPTSALTEAEVRRLFAIMDRLRREGVAIMFVTHRLEEASAMCDRMAVLRDGRLAGHLAREGGRPIPVPRVIERMVGRAASDLYARRGRGGAPGPVRLRVRGLRTERPADAAHAVALGGVDLDLRAGEVLGVAGLVGSGRTELARALFGADPTTGGTVELDGRPIAPRSPAEARDLGIGLVPEDRKAQAILADLPIRHNYAVAALDRYAGPFGVMAARREGADLARWRQAMSIRMASPEQAIAGLSGGNQQKVVLARWLARDPAVLIVDEPTRGVDVGAKAEVHQILVTLAERGIAVLMISSELPEVLAVSDRIVVMRGGRIVGEVAGADATEEGLMALMALEPRAEVPA